jgi:hypothetical protein
MTKVLLRDDAGVIFAGRRWLCYRFVYGGLMRCYCPADIRALQGQIIFSPAVSLNYPSLDMKKLLIAVLLLQACGTQKPTTVYTGGRVDSGKAITIIPKQEQAAACATMLPKAKANPSKYYIKEKAIFGRVPGYLPAYNY